MNILLESIESGLIFTLSLSFWFKDILCIIEFSLK